MSESFNIQKGVRQGCPMSSFIFIICIQILPKYINNNNNNNIKGIIVQDKEIKQSLFADDATFFNNGSLESYENLIQTLNDFSKYLGLKLNVKIISITCGIFKWDLHTVLFK